VDTYVKDVFNPHKLVIMSFPRRRESRDSFWSSFSFTFFAANGMAPCIQASPPTLLSVCTSIRTNGWTVSLGNIKFTVWFGMKSMNLGNLHFKEKNRTCPCEGRDKEMEKAMEVEVDRAEQPDLG